MSNGDLTSDRRTNYRLGVIWHAATDGPRIRDQKKKDHDADYGQDGRRNGERQTPIDVDQCAGNERSDDVAHALMSPPYAQDQP